MSSSREEAMARLRKWSAAKAPIKASFVGRGLMFNATGRIVLDADESKLWVVTGDEDNPRMALALSLGTAVPCETFEPLLDAPEDVRWQMDFFIAEAFELPCGNLDFREMAEGEESS